MAEQLDLHVVCKHCGSEVSPYITECPYCGQRLRKRAPKLTQDGTIAPPAPKTGRFRRRGAQRDRPLAWLAAERPYVTIALVLAGAVVYAVDRSTDLGILDLGGVIGPLNGDVWRLGASQFVYENVGYILAVGIAVAIFGSSLERRYGWPVPIFCFLLPGAVGMYLATLIESFPVALGGNGSALGVLFAWLVRDLRNRQSGFDTESDLLGVAVIAAVLALMPLLETTADGWVGLGGAATGALIGLLLPKRV